jgi:hypothetical protein
MRVDRAEPLRKLRFRTRPLRRLVQQLPDRVPTLAGLEKMRHQGKELFFAYASAVEIDAGARAQVYRSPRQGQAQLL